jgi:hypothetical protein
MRKVTGFALLVLLGMAPIAGAATKVDVSTAKIKCDTVLGTVGIKPGLTFVGASPVVASIKGTLDGCTVTGATATILSGSFSGKLNGPSNNCNNLNAVSPLTGTLTFKWKADPTTPLLQTSSVVTVATLTGGLYAAAAPLTGTYGLLQLGITGVTGAFAGADGGTTSNDSVASGNSVPALAADCLTTGGIKKITLGIGEITLQ